MSEQLYICARAGRLRMCKECEHSSPHIRTKVGLYYCDIKAEQCEDPGSRRVALGICIPIADLEG